MCAADVVTQAAAPAVVFHANDDAWDDSALIAAWDLAMATVTAAPPRKSTPPSPWKRPPHRWSVGAACRAAWSEDGMIYAAAIDSIDEDAGTCEITFVDYGNSEEVRLSSLLPSTTTAPKRSTVLADKSASASDPTGNYKALDWAVGDACSCVYVEDGLVYPAVVKEINSKLKTCTVQFAEGHRQFETPLWELQSKGHRPAGAQPAPQASFGHGAPSFAADHPSDPPCGTGTNAPPHIGGFAAGDSLANMIMSWYQSGFHTGYYMAMQHCNAAHNRT